MKLLRTPLVLLALSIPATAHTQNVEIGKDLYDQYCATCHGADGGGSGPLTEIMLEKPSESRTWAGRTAPSSRLNQSTKWGRWALSSKRVVAFYPWLCIWSRFRSNEWGALIYAQTLQACTRTLPRLAACRGR